MEKFGSIDTALEDNYHNTYVSGSFLEDSKLTNGEDEFLPGRDRLLKHESISNDQVFSSGKKQQSTFQHLFFQTEILDYSITLQKWRGVITKVNENSFEAELEDLSNYGTKEIVEIEFKGNVSPDDKELVNLGAVFYWSIDERHEKGQVIKQSIIRFQRLAKWRRKQYKEAIDRANLLNKKISFD